MQGFVSVRFARRLGPTLLAVASAWAPYARSADPPMPPPSWPAIAERPDGAPSVVLIMTDDVGFGASSTFGGPVETPTLDSLARTGVRYNMMHTTGICSPTRAALLTGRNHTAVAMGNVANAATGYEGYTSVIPRSAATIARVLRDAGYSTAMFGKSHMIPPWETGPAGPFDRWPTGQGFQHFYGFLDGDTNQWSPALYHDTQPIDPARGRPDYFLERDLADRAIAWMRQQRATAPRKPLFLYYAPGTAHAPHHAPREWIERYRGRFDAGWDEVRRATLDRQLQQGVVPRGTKLAQRFEPVPPWSTLTPRQKKVYARQMEVFAGALSFVDAQIGRVVAEARDLLDDDKVMVIYLQGDNGASAEAGLDGTLNEHGVLNGISASFEEMERRLDELGGPRAYGHFSIGWASATNTPFPLAKQISSNLGAVRNGMVIDWPGHTTHPETVRGQFAHVVDIAPTILEATGVPAPASVEGVAQQSIAGVSLLPTLTDPQAPEIRRTQFFSIWDNMGIYHDGWWAGTLPHAVPWVMPPTQPRQIQDRQWQLFDLRSDFSQSTDLAARHPDKLAELQALFWSEAQREKALPIHRSEGRAGMPGNLAGVSTVRFVGPQARLPEDAAPSLIGRSFTLRASIEIPTAGAEGTLLAVGGRFGGMSWHLIDGRPVLHYNLADVQRFEVASDQPLAPGAHQLEARFEASGRGGPAEITLLTDGVTVGAGKIPRTLPFRFSLDETLDVGSDQGTPVSEAYASPFPYTGSLEELTIELAPAGR